MDNRQTTIGKIPGGIAAQCPRGFFIKLRKSGQNLQDHSAPTVSRLTA